MRIVLIRQTKGKAKEVADLVQQYVQRCRPYAQIEIFEPKSRGNADKFDPPAVWSESSTKRVVLDDEGRQHTSSEMAAKLRKWKEDPGVKQVAFYVGGPYGIPDNITRSAHETWSLSKGTFPSDLAWLVLAEQLYRSLSILAGSPYHHE